MAYTGLRLSGTHTDTGCSSNDDCQQDKACFSGHCKNPCVMTEACGLNADCRAINHIPHCSCPQSYSGDPAVRCSPITPGKCQLHDHIGQCDMTHCDFIFYCQQYQEILCLKATSLLLDSFACVSQYLLIIIAIGLLVQLCLEYNAK